ncbi:MAG TPA: hypothetical protein VJA86_02090 [Candidatus Nanoarchaeia archaeon]|nr:hypothetical protein [Candidatus Nanoarchaeia archaeon]
MAKEIPVGVKIIAVLYYIIGIVALVFAIIYFVGGMMEIPSMAGDLSAGGISWLLLFIAIFITIVLIALAIFGIFVGRGLWKKRGWARITAITFHCFVVFIVIYLIVNIFAILERAGGTVENKLIWVIIGLIVSIINLTIAGYLAFSKAVKDAFSL